MFTWRRRWGKFIAVASASTFKAMSASFRSWVLQIRLKDVFLSNSRMQKEQRTSWVARKREMENEQQKSQSRDNFYVLSVTLSRSFRSIPRQHQFIIQPGDARKFVVEFRVLNKFQLASNDVRLHARCLMMCQNNNELSVYDFAWFSRHWTLLEENLLLSCCRFDSPCFRARQ